MTLGTMNLPLADDVERCWDGMKGSCFWVQTKAGCQLSSGGQSGLISNDATEQGHSNAQIKNGQRVQAPSLRQRCEIEMTMELQGAELRVGS